MDLSFSTFSLSYLRTTLEDNKMDCLFGIVYLTLEFRTQFIFAFTIILHYGPIRTQTLHHNNVTNWQSIQLTYKLSSNKNRVWFQGMKFTGIWGLGNFIPASPFLLNFIFNFSRILAREVQFKEEEESSEWVKLIFMYRCWDGFGYFFSYHLSESGNTFGVELHMLMWGPFCLLWSV